MHLIVLLGLAWFTLSDEVRQGSIILEVAETPDSVVFNTTPIVLDPVELDEAGEFELSELALSSGMMLIWISRAFYWKNMCCQFLVLYVQS